MILSVDQTTKQGNIRSPDVSFIAAEYIALKVGK